MKREIGKTQNTHTIDGHEKVLSRLDQIEQLIQVLEDSEDELLLGQCSFHTLIVVCTVVNDTVHVQV